MLFVAGTAWVGSFMFAVSMLIRFSCRTQRWYWLRKMKGVEDERPVKFSGRYMGGLISCFKGWGRLTSIAIWLGHELLSILKWGEIICSALPRPVLGSVDENEKEKHKRNVNGMNLLPAHLQYILQRSWESTHYISYHILETRLERLVLGIARRIKMIASCCHRAWD